MSTTSAEKPVKIPGPGHPIEIRPTGRRVRIRFAGRVVAETTRALSLSEGKYPLVQYIPREDVDMTFFRRSAHTTYCPYKGDCAYYSLAVEGRTSENAVWTYEAPFAAVAEIKDQLAFYPDRVDAIEVGD